MYESKPKRQVTVVLALASLAAAAAWSQGTSDPARLAGFRAESHAAMSRMMGAMVVPTSGSIDHDFAAMMIPHHQGAIDMAVAELRYGTSPVLRRIAQEIVVTQKQEIEVMRRELDSLPMGRAASAVPAPTSRTPHQTR